MEIKDSTSVIAPRALEPTRLETDILKTNGATRENPQKMADSDQPQNQGPLDALSALLTEDDYNINFELNFHIHKDTNQLVVKVMDPQTNKVIREIPPEELLVLAEKIHQMVGLLFDKKV